MRKVVLIVALSIISQTIVAQHQHPNDAKPATLMPGLGKHHHKVSTSNADAQRFFDQGLTFVFAFNHDEAIRSFRHAAELDPQLAMAYWGIALATGPNYNMDIDLEREKAAYDAVQKARSLAVKASGQERDYIEALSKRYSNDPKPDLKRLAVEYKNAMGELSKRYPDDLDAATLYAESLMDLNPWQLWSKDGKPAHGTEEIVEVLESVLRRDPNHAGANHFYIHAVEASSAPERALDSAERLKTLVPAAGHLVHMPAHIFMRTGNYEAASLANEAGAAADRAYLKGTGARGLYSAMYYNHNLHFLAMARSMQGRYRDARKALAELEANTLPMAREMPMVDTILPASLFVMVRFRRVEDILTSKQPDPSLLPITNAFWHYARGMAFAAIGKVAEAETERQSFSAAAKATAVDVRFGLNSVSDIFAIGSRTLEARIARAKGDRKSAIELLKEAVALEDRLAYNEPADWGLPCRESLGGVLLLDGQHVEAETVFRRDLKENPNNPRSLFGLAESLRLQGKRDAAREADKQFKDAWKSADARLRIEDL
jgi:tetratricopeptide (TPR) repeat protein